jgi:hypothetical protein
MRRLKLMVGSGLALLLTVGAAFTAGTARAAQAPAPAAASDAQTEAVAKLDPIFQTWLAEQHAPGLVYGVVADGRLVSVRACRTCRAAAR